MKSQNIYEYNKLKPLDLGCAAIRGISKELTLDEQLIYMMNKINELVVEYNHLAKDFELYKKAFKRYSQPAYLDDISCWNKTNAELLLNRYVEPTIFPQHIWPVNSK